MEELNRTIEVQGAAIRSIGWEDYASPGVGAYPQDVINRQILKEYDILIAIFGMRLGSPTKTQRSGTVEELENALRKSNSDPSAPHVQVYFSDRIERASSITPEDFSAVMEYRKELSERGVLYSTFTSDEQLATNVRVDVQRYVQANLSSSSTRQDKISSPPAFNTDGDADSEDNLPGFLDLMALFEEASQVSTSSLNKQTTILEQITAETKKRTGEIDSGAFNNASAIDQKRSMNAFADFLKARALEIIQESASSRDAFRASIDALIALFEMDKAEDSESRNADKRARLIETANSLLHTIGETKEATTRFRQSVFEMPKITIQFNQAKKQLTAAVDTQLSVFNEMEERLVTLTSKQ